MDTIQSTNSSTTRLVMWTEDWLAKEAQKPGILGSFLSLVREASKTPPAPDFSSSNKISSVWDNCSEIALECLQTSKVFPCIKAFSVCSGADDIIKRSKIFDHVTINTEAALNLTKNSIRTLAKSFFDFCNLPPLPAVTSSLCPSPDYIAVGAISTTALIQPFITNFACGKVTPLAQTINKGLVTGAAMAWAFDQNLYVGAITGVSTALPIDFVFHHTIKRAFASLQNLYQKDYVKGTFEAQITLVKYLTTASILALCYSQTGGLIPFSNDLPLRILNLPLSVTLAAGTILFALKYPITLLEGIYDNTKAVIGTIAGSPEIPFIAYSSLYLTLCKEPILNYVRENFTYAKCLALYNEASSELLTCWKKGQDLEHCEKNTLALYTLSALGLLLTGIVTYKLFGEPAKEIKNSTTQTSPRKPTPTTRSEFQTNHSVPLRPSTPPKRESDADEKTS